MGTGLGKYECFIYWYSKRIVLVINIHFYWSYAKALSTLVVSKPNQLCQSICQQAETIIMNPIVLFPTNPTNYHTEFVQVLLWLPQTIFLVYNLSSPLWIRNGYFDVHYSINFITYMLMVHVKIYNTSLWCKNASLNPAIILLRFQTW